MTPGYGSRTLRFMKGLMLRNLPLMITCREFEEFLLDYLEGNLPRGQRRIFDLHLAICRECRDYLAAYKETMTLGKRAFDDPAAALPKDVPEDLITAVLEARRPDSEK
ncbi:anti-sigma factor family protein [Pelagibius sp.]|uniref:anti-sigma factor family protein n=1 Tax=Pelagibius sp. TaxID=1931238 RepID=UPI003B50E24D